MPQNNLDDVLLNQSATPEPVTQEAPPEASDDSFDVSHETQTQEPDSGSENNEYGLTEENKTATNPEGAEIDEYGNQRTAPKVFTEDEVNERINAAIRERLARLERNSGHNQQPTQQQQQQAQQAGFEYDAQSGETWQQQLAAFTEQVIVQREQRQLQQAQTLREQQAQAEYDAKFMSGISRYKDFKEVVSKQPIDDVMIMGTRGMENPAAFLYTAAKRAPQELQRIAQIQDPYAKIAEIGRLEEKMRKVKLPTQSPKPISPTKGDAPIPNSTDKKKPTLDDLLAQENAKRAALYSQRRR